MRAATALLESARSLDGLVDVVRAAGLCGELVDVDDATRASLDMREGEPRIGAGPGAVRLIAFRVLGDVAFREALHRVARRLVGRAPHVLWFVAALDQHARSVAILGLSGGSASPRVASFAWEPDNVVDSDAETLCALKAVRRDDDVLFHARSLELLGRDSLTRRFYRALEGHVTALAETVPRRIVAEDARQFALLYVSRLLFLRFLEAKSWLNGDRAFIASAFDACMHSGRGFHRSVLLPLFFGTLNTPVSRRASAARAFGAVPFLNGGLFTRTAVERRVGGHVFPDAQLGAVLQEVFARFRFVAREDSATWSEASVDPEMLGRAFESLMAAGERKATGVYYTPHELVARVAEHALQPFGAPRSLAALREIRVLDPACGSGAFLVHVLERLAELRRALGDDRPVAVVRRDVLGQSIFGVDRNPTAVWLCELRLWLSVVVESEESDPLQVAPLPNLDRNIRVGDALAGAGFGNSSRPLVGSARLEEARRRYVRATGARKANLSRTLERLERARVIAFLDRSIEATRYVRRELLTTQRTRDLFGRRPAPTPATRAELRQSREQLRTLRRERMRIADGGAVPFSFPACFAEAHARGGFDVVVGNPPWVRLHHIPATMRTQLKQNFEVFRAPTWAAEAGIDISPGFASQVDLSAFFVERAASLLRDTGILSLLLPMKLWRSLAGSALREFLNRRTTVYRLDDLSESKHVFEATTYPSLLLARASPARSGKVAVSVHRGSCSEEWDVDLSALTLDGTPGAPWLTLTPRVRLAFDRLRNAGDPLHKRFGLPRLGVKSGCNAAFVVRILDTARTVAHVVDADGQTGTIELGLLRPVLRGDGVAIWHAGAPREWIIWTHADNGVPLERLPERTAQWLRRRYGALVARSDAARQKRWWSLFRIEAADWRRPRLVWADFGRRPRAIVLPAGDRTVPMNTCYVLPCASDADAWALAALLNSRLAAAWLNAIAEPARGGYHRYLAWTVGLLPVPRDWSRAREILGECRDKGDVEQLERILVTYGLRCDDVRDLLDVER
jgi:hypothetical protein